MMYSIDNINELTEMGQATLEHLEKVFDIPQGQKFNLQLPAQEDNDPRFADA